MLWLEKDLLGPSVRRRTSRAETFARLAAVLGLLESSAQQRHAVLLCRLKRCIARLEDSGHLSDVDQAVHFLGRLAATSGQVRLAARVVKCVRLQAAAHQEDSSVVLWHFPGQWVAPIVL